ncbi:serine hydrolase domain-containing protein [Runella slithyformis]|uniref:Beta-lactamase n=1 Tax=Runella slithyformis (strain ATCC 29530 / DSM 19594 / LMG 11500 / NCIMB 11436 / LSU 4) TaxID=761193 RepID=A0A7U3ZRD6_RUNSL|nr:serine hydrolase domain-containing protein [Runella slithyformis]AEI51965.1 beta-lactamase [Runella slithyformis DSM 19594]
MKNTLFLLLLSIVLYGCKTEEMILKTNTSGSVDVPLNARHRLAEPLQAILDKHAKKGIPGMVAAIKDAQGFWVGTAGYARLEDQTRMQPYHRHLAYSIAKTYTATLMMKLKERGFIKLDEPIKNYLPQNISSRITGSDKITVRQLLNQTSGLPDFSDQLSYSATWLNTQMRGTAPEQLLEYVYNKPLLFESGKDWAYSNTNFLLAALAIEHITKKSYSQVLNEEILQPLGLKQTFAQMKAGEIEQKPVPNFYFAKYSDLRIENITRGNLATHGYSSMGEDGILASPTDYLRFLEALVQRKIVTDASLKEMMTWVQGKNSTEPDYGLGLYWVNYGKLPAEIGHQGAGLGGRTSLLHFTNNGITVFVATNVGMNMGGPYARLITDFINEVNEFVAAQ